MAKRKFRIENVTITHDKGMDKGLAARKYCEIMGLELVGVKDLSRYGAEWDYKIQVYYKKYEDGDADKSYTFDKATKSIKNSVK